MEKKRWQRSLLSSETLWLLRPSSAGGARGGDSSGGGRSKEPLQLRYSRPLAPTCSTLGWRRVLVSPAAVLAAAEVTLVVPLTT